MSPKNVWLSTIPSMKEISSKEVLKFALLGASVITSYHIISAFYFRYTDTDHFPELFFYEASWKVLSNQKRLLDFMMECFKFIKESRQSDSFTFQVIGMPRIVFTNNLENVTYVLKTRMENFGKGPAFNIRFKGLLGDGIFNVDGKAWFHHRKVSIISPRCITKILLVHY